MEDQLRKERIEQRKKKRKEKKRRIYFLPRDIVSEIVEGNDENTTRLKNEIRTKGERSFHWGRGTRVQIEYEEEVP